MATSQDFVNWVCSDALDHRFLKYVLMAEDRHLLRFASGTTHQTIYFPEVEAFHVLMPRIDVQKQIAAVLAAFDELIEINERRIDVLEDLARSLYREWFVRFRFPGHESIELVHSELGLIPSGWEPRPLHQFVTTQYGYTASAAGDPVGPKFLRGMDINKRSFIDWSTVPYCAISESERSRFSLDLGDVVVIRMADPGKVGIIESSVDAVFASYLVRLRSHEQRFPPYLLFHYLSSDAYQDWVTGASSGSTRKSASAKVMTEPVVALPTEDVSNRFVENVAPLRSQLAALIEQNARLASTRDLLLPRLVTGALDISDIDLGALMPSEVA